MKNTIIKADNVSYIYGTDNEKLQNSPAVKDLDLQIKMASLWLLSAGMDLENQPLPGF